MIELSSEARRAYEVMVSNIEQTSQAEAEQAVNTEEELQISSLAEKADTSPERTQPEEPEYSKFLSWTNICNTCSFKTKVGILPVKPLESKICRYAENIITGCKSNKNQIIIFLYFF